MIELIAVAVILSLLVSVAIYSDYKRNKRLSKKYDELIKINRELTKEYQKRLEVLKRCHKN